MNRRLVIVVALSLVGCSGNAMRNAYQPVALNGQTAQVLDSDNVECRAIGYRAGQVGAGAPPSGGLVLVGGGAGTLAGGSTGGAAGVGAAIAIDGSREVYRRGLLMHAAYRACMSARGYKGAQE